MKYIFVTGGVVSSLGKGLTAAALGTLLENRGLKVALQKFDPYLNVDLSWIAEQGQRIGTDIPIVFVKQSKPLQQIVESMSRQYPDLQLYFSEPTQVAELVQRLGAQRRQEHRVGETMNNQKKSRWGWRW